MGWNSAGPKAGQAWSCNCIGPQNGEPLCPCMMRGISQKNGRWVRPEQDLGPVQTQEEKHND